MSQPILITLIRHANDNLQKIIQGQKDTTLNPQGISQATTTGAYLRDQAVKFDEIWSSDLQRAHKTAQIIAQHQSHTITVQTDSRLRERFLGDLQGKQWTPGADQSSAEPPSQVLQRLLAFWTELINRLESSPSSSPRRVLLVSHGAALRTLVQMGLQKSYELDPSVIEPIVFANCSITDIQHSPHRIILRAGVCDHLHPTHSDEQTNMDAKHSLADDLASELAP